MGVVIADPTLIPGTELMRFRLTYEGQLDTRGADNKQEIRKALHPQLQSLWATSPNLRARKVTCGQPDNSRIVMEFPDYAVWKNLYPSLGPYRFVPIVGNDICDVAVSVNVLLLRRNNTGSMLQRGDLDNGFYPVSTDG